MPDTHPNPAADAAIRRASSELAASLTAREIPPDRAAQIASSCSFSYFPQTGQLLIGYGRKENGDARLQGLADQVPDLATRIAASENLQQQSEEVARRAGSGGAYDPVADGKARAAAEKKRNDNSLAFK